MRRNGSRTRGGRRLFAPIAAVAIGLGVPLAAGVAAAQEGPPGNNGTVKVDGLPFDDHPDNEPHPGCRFEIDWYNFDAGVVSTVTFETQNPTGVRDLGADPATVTLDNDPNEGGDVDGLDGHQEYTLSFTADDFFHPNQGYHVKLTINTEGSIGADVKHKVFWVSECEVIGGTTTTIPPGGTSTTTPPGGTSTTTPPGGTGTSTPPTVGGGGGTSTTTVAGESGTNTSPPSGLAFTGPEDLPWLVAATLGLLLAGALALRLASGAGKHRAR